MGALETVGAGIAGIAAARVILGSPRAAAGAAAASTASFVQSAKPVGTVALAAVGGATAGALLGVGALKAGDDRDRFDYGINDMRERIGWSAGVVVAATVGAVASSSSPTARIAGGLFMGAAVAAGGAVINFTHDEMPPPPVAAKSETAPPVSTAFASNADLAGKVIGTVGYDREHAVAFHGRKTWFDGAPTSSHSFSSREAALAFVDSRERQLEKGGALVHESFDVDGNWSVTYLDDHQTNFSRLPPSFWEHDAAGNEVASKSVLVLPDGRRIESK